MRNILKENFLVSTFLVFYLIHSMQIGIGVLDFRSISQHAGQDAWISIIISGLSIHIILWLLYQILNNGKGDLIAIHKELFGKWIGGLFSFLFVIYLLILGFTVLRVYVEIIQLWVFPQLSVWFFSFVLLLTVSYFVIKGFRVVTGICFLSTLYLVPILLTFLFPLKFAHYSNLLPIMDHSMTDILGSARNATLTMSGFELIFIFYPFIKRPDKSAKWAHLAILSTTLIYVVLALITFVFYNQDQLQHMLWSTVMFWKIIELPAIERLEHLGIAIWLFIVLPNICLTLWGAHRGLGQLIPINKRVLIIILISALVAVSALFETRSMIDQLRAFTGEISFYFIYGYIPFLFILQKIIYKIRGNN
ncbi:GerAB/ArcD/ProY family transporter [Oceanobacillus sp. FSL K6-2867]|uniref:GerAB/ArcD/ProY family transporter n=1 Tax=Oceanobacillus sp. FSL K6-2867 TaxID=2954748 RepID=UPI0030D84B9D